MKPLLILLAALPFVACSTATEKCTSVNQDRIHQSLSASYTKSDNSTQASARFRFGDGTGTTLEMDGNCNITHGSITLSKSTFLGTSYSGDATGFVANHTFIFTDNNSKTFTNSSTIREIAFARSAPTTVSRTGTTTVTFSPALETGETAYLYLVGQKTNVSGYSDVLGSTTVTISESDKKDFPLGTAEIYLQLIKSPSLTEKTSTGGSFTTSYENAHESVTVNE